MSDKHSIKTEWKGNLAFESNVDGHIIKMDAPEAGGGDNSGPSPKKLQLVALSGCTGMDVVSILKKMRIEIDKCTVEVQGELTDEHPRYYSNMHIIYELSGKNLPLDKVEKAVKMSEDTYCGVGALYKMAIPVSSEIRIIES